MIIWKYKHKPMPNIGEVSETEHFALFPVKVNTRDWVWWETVIAVSRYDENSAYWDGDSLNKYAWNFLYFRRKVNSDQ